MARRSEARVLRRFEAYNQQMDTIGGRSVEMRENIIIEFCTVSSSLGLVLAAKSDRGLCAVYMGEEPQELEFELRSAFPDSLFQSAPGTELELITEQIAHLVESPFGRLEVSLDLRGTEFQRRVWSALSAIPVGRTISYAELARQLGSPLGVRAVARACAANQLSIVIPCHRVVRSDGALSGYRWGAWRKRALLDRELSATMSDQERVL